MKRFLLFLCLCLSALAQNAPYPLIVTNTAQLALLNPTGMRAAILVSTNGNVEFAYDPGATDVTNTSTTAPIIKPVSYAGRWVGKQVGSGSGGGDMLRANNLSDVANAITARSNINGERQRTFNVLDYGAPTDNTSDASAAFAAAIAALPSNGGTIYLPKYVFNIPSLTISKAKVRFLGEKGTEVRCSSSTNSITFLVVSADDFTSDGVYWNGNGKPQTVIFLNNGIKAPTIINGEVSGCMANSTNDPSGTAIASLLNIRRGTTNAFVFNNYFHGATNIPTATGRSAVGINLTDVGNTSTNDQIRGVKIISNRFSDIGASSNNVAIDGNGVYISTTPGYMAGSIISENTFDGMWNRSVKIAAGDGHSVSKNFTWKYDGGTGFAVFSDYGSSNVFEGNFSFGSYYLGIEIGVTNVAARGGSYRGNYFVNDPSNTNSYGFTANNAQNFLIDDNYAENVISIGRIIGPSKFVLVNNSYGTNISNDGIVITSDANSISPSNISIDGVMAGSSGGYGVRAFSGTNIFIKNIYGTYMSGKFNFAGTVTGSLGVEADIQNATASSLMKFDSQLRAVNADLSGDVTTSGGVATTIANQAVTYAKMQNVSASQRVHGRNTAGAGATEEVTVSQLFDWLGSTRGSIPYRGASGWAVATPGTATYVWTSNGSGADPSWQAPSASGSQTPWTSDINGNGKSLTNVLSIDISNNGIHTNSSITIYGSTDGTGYTITNNASGNYRETLPGSGVSGLVVYNYSSSNVTRVATATSSQLATFLSDETGSGASVFATSPTLVTPVLGAATATTINGMTVPSVSDTVVGKATTDTFSNKTFDAANTGNTLKFKNYLIFSTPHLGDGIGAIPQTNDYTLPTFGHYKFSGSAATNANYVVYIVSVPTDIDTSVDLRARVKVRLSATETSASTFNIGVQDVADSNAGSFAGVTSAATWVQVPISSDASGAANDIETSAWITLTGWKSALTADHTMYIVLNRDGAGDTANTGISDAELKIEYGVTQ